MSSTRPQMNLRIADQDRVLFDLAAEALGTSRSDFMIQACRKQAELTLMDRSDFHLDHETWEAFVEELDRPSNNPKGIDKLRSAHLPWQK